MNKQQLLDLKENINEAKDKVNRLEGRKEHLISDLKDKWNCESIEEAKALRTEFEDDIADIDAKIEDKTNELTEKYPDLT